MLKRENTDSPLLRSENPMVSSPILTPNLEMIESIVSQNSPISRTKDKLEDVDYRVLAKDHLASEKVFDQYRENLDISIIQEITDFNGGKGIVEWKIINNLQKSYLIGRSKMNEIAFYIDTNSDHRFEEIQRIQFDREITFEVLKYFDSQANAAKDLLLVSQQKTISFYEITEKNLKKRYDRVFANSIESIMYIKHGDLDVIMFITEDSNEKFQAKFLLIDFQTGDSHVLQFLTLSSRPKNVTSVDVGSEMIVAFVHEDLVNVYRSQTNVEQKNLKFELVKQIDAKGVTTTKGFRIGGHSYLAIGGNDALILRYVNGEFQHQTHFGQSFGFVENFLPIPLRTYRDDLILLVQHRLDFESHSIAAVDALIWNGIEFITAYSVPCDVVVEPHPQGFTCTLDPDRTKGLIGATFYQLKKENSFILIVPKKNAPSGIFKVTYEIVEAEDPLMKEISNLKKSIEKIELMLDYEELVRENISEILRNEFDPRNDFVYSDVHNIEEFDTEFLQFEGDITILNDEVKFIGSTWTREDFLNLEENLDEIERTLEKDEQILREIDEKLNKVNRINRQIDPQTESSSDSPTYFIGSFPINGQIVIPKTLNTESHDGRTDRNRRQAGDGADNFEPKPIEVSRVSEISAKNLQLNSINGVPFDNIQLIDEDGVLRVPNKHIKFQENLQVDNVEMVNDGKINGIDLDRELLSLNNLPRNIEFDQLIVQELEVDSLNKVPVDLTSLKQVNIPKDGSMNITLNKVDFINLNVNFINGVDVKEFFSKLVPKHRNHQFDELIVDGNITIATNDGEIYANNLNEFSFPEDFVLRRGPPNTQIIGKKRFVGNLGKIQF